ncbi:hypothetical protein Pcinc_000747 [Petrolisthes cinctipes]|uniref:procollagen-proline 4-dioxygenase n=1 Tax=Petrolisthes cinctipes TaxID=88211 RepID=A0AAE1L4K6_PETCI|nr:hypothetical protein Pcinc_000747 [Petrolisthes cinctipes]
MVLSVSVRQGNAEPQSGQLFASLVYMRHVFHFDELLGEVLLQLPEHFPPATDYLKTYMSLALDRIRGQEVTGNPLHVYTVIKRLVHNWPNIKPALEHYLQAASKGCEDTHPECHNWSMVNECVINRNYMLVYCPQACHVCPSPALRSEVLKLVSASETTVLPTSDDLTGAALALTRLQRIYRLPINSFMAGYIAGVSSSVRLGLDDCLLIANTSLSHGEYSYALVWYRYCLLLTEGQHDTHQLVKDQIREAEIEHNAKFKVWGPGEFIYQQPVTPDNNRQVPQDNTFAKGCRGEHVQFPGWWRLKCHVDHRGSPFLLLQPIRYEQLHYDPELYIFYDVISDAEIDVIKSLSKELLKVSTVQYERLGESSKISTSRVSYTAWIFNGSHPMLPRLAQRVAHITGLHVYESLDDTMAGEGLQVLNYGIGGFYMAHMDLLFRNDPVKLSDVTAGGRTSFPNAGVSAPPVRGSAVFWYNTKLNGQPNHQSLHGGCPVLMGEKWVANKWIRENANFLRRPCTTDNNQ